MDESVLPPADDQDNQSSQLHEQTEHDEENIEYINEPSGFGIEEVENDENDDDAEKGGLVESWELQRFIEHRTMRSLLTYCTIALWVIWTLSGLVHFLLTGNVFLITTSPPLALFLRIIFRYYFR
jgi:hypothetical protein